MAKNSSASDLELHVIKKNSITGAISYFSRTILLQLIGFASSLVLSALLTASDYGIYGAVVAVIGVLVFFSDIGLAAALVQKKEVSEEDYRTAFTVQQSLSWVIFLITIFIAYTGALSVRTGPLGNWIMLSLGVSFPLASLKTIPSVMLERKLEFSKLVMPQIVEQIAFHGSLIAAVLAGWGVLAYVPAILLRSLSGVVAMYFVQPWKIKLGWSNQAFKRLISFGAQFQANDLLARIKDQLFYLFLAYRFQPAEFGYINWAKNWSMYPYTLTVQNVTAITFPAFSRLQHESHYLKRAIEKSLFFISLSIFPLLTGMCIFIYPLLEVFSIYAHWKPAALSLVLFTISIAGGAISTPLTNTLNALGKINITLRLMILWTAMTWILTPIAIHFYGFDGVAIAAFIISLTSFLPIYFVKKIVKISVLDQLWRQTLATMVMAVVGVIGINFWSSSVSSLLLGMLITGLSYVLILVVIGRKKIISEIRSLKS